MATIVNPRLNVDDRCLDELADAARLRAVAKVMTVRDAHTDATLLDYVRYVADLLQAPICVLSLVLDNTLLFVAAHGMAGMFTDMGGMPVQWSACSLVVQRNADVLITDTHRDPRHTRNPVVTVGHVRSYAGVPVRDPDGHIVATLCVLHHEPDAFTAAELQKLATLAPRAQRLLHVAP